MPSCSAFVRGALIFRVERARAVGLRLGEFGRIEGSCRVCRRPWLFQPTAAWCASLPPACRPRWGGRKREQKKDSSVALLLQRGHAREIGTEARERLWPRRRRRRRRRGGGGGWGISRSRGKVLSWAGCKQTVAGLSAHRRGSHRLRGPVALVTVEPMGAAVQRLEMSCWVDWVVIRMDQHGFVTRQVNERLRLGQGHAAETDGMRWPCAARDDSLPGCERVSSARSRAGCDAVAEDARTIRPDMMMMAGRAGARTGRGTCRRTGEQV